ncbi:hypothetical protein INS49_007913 [Diaporthe citri]|uniref:uncharacterized protein n=1 Tax=Diaporthe citri TaxID=83186 RepID=UPI001C812CC0|nr:uncharacterized protein INS49_007913 [Diaporthe citri]KAG6362819.1 hypothetical protein INS49_007913 [Diaporthe citri]
MKIFELRGKPLLAVIIITSGLDFMLFGYDQGLFGGILGGQRFKDTLGNPDATMTGLVTAIYDIGCALGAVAAFVWGERIGRKWSIVWANVIVIVAAVIQCTSFEYWQMFVARIIGGLGVGLSTVAVPILQSETLPAHNRGALLVIQSAVTILGVALASWLCFATLYANSLMQWRFPARQVISRLLDKHPDDDEVQGQLQEILEALSLESRSSEPFWSEVFSNSTKSRNLHRVFLGMGPYMMNQWSGINTYTAAAAAVAFMFIFLDCFTFGIMPVSWYYSAEIQPLNVRNKATAVGVFSHWMSNFVVVMVTPIGLNNIRGHYFWVWAAVSASCVPPTCFCGVETSGRTLEQIDVMFYENPRILMGLNPENRRVVRSTVADEEERFKNFAHAKDANVEMVEDVSQ